MTWNPNRDRARVVPTVALADAIVTTYRPSRLEADWLMDAFGDWLADGTIEDVLYAVRGGKEANVYACRGGPGLGGGLLAAKVYRPRRFRELSNDAIYREGRGLLDRTGQTRKGRDRRMQRAVDRGTKLGKRAAHTSWVMHELAALRAVHAAGGSVPEPVAASEHAVLMRFVGDEHGAAPTLDRVALTATEAAQGLEVALHTVEVLLRLGWVHGDLSAYNLLWWDAGPVIIDLPQVADVLRNPHAPALFLRDVQRLCEAFRSRANPRDVADDLWDAVFGGEDGVPDGVIAHAPRFEPDEVAGLRRVRRVGAR